MKKLLGLLALTAAVVLSPAARAQMRTCTPTNNCYVFSTSGNATFQVTAIPPGTTSINLQIVSTAVTVAGTAQIQTSAATSGGALVSPVNCGSSVAVGTAGVITATCNYSSTQPWSWVGVALSGVTGTTSGDALIFQSTLLGIINFSPATSYTWVGLQSFTNAAQVTYNGAAGPAQSYPANTVQFSNLGSGVSYVDSVGIDSTHVGSWDFRQVSSTAGTFFDSLTSDVSGNWTTHGGVTPGSSTVASLPAASSSAGMTRVVTDSTAISSEGQACVGSSTNKALAFSNGTTWKCF